MGVNARGCQRVSGGVSACTTLSASVVNVAVVGGVYGGDAGIEGEGVAVKGGGYSSVEIKSGYEWMESGSVGEVKSGEEGEKGGNGEISGTEIRIYETLNCSVIKVNRGGVITVCDVSISCTESYSTSTRALIDGNGRCLSLYPSIRWKHM